MLVLFDIDDTLVDHSRAFHAATQALHREIGQATPFDDFLRIWTVAHRRHFDRYLAGEISYEEQARERVRTIAGAETPDSAADGIWHVHFTSYEAAWTDWRFDLRGV
jgi:putative hydrolase of the HAD superfamily